ncbi:hypothetical protein OTB20_18835 [Streptomyces sp. H27-H1]|uniref:hypothetical protein n=1 Tax=Streptomyces sp. H27-H1 TaxID=2996461 RepID=UPI00226E64F1|nr:hypothetical protein [Streptomyces sp. H27-H1]MCY0928214.1 hypothetical protein [Streptomyces sp. H27-H1]
MEAPHLYLGWHPEYGFVAASSPRLTDHLRDWALERVQFEPVPGTNLHRLTEPSQDGQRRARQAVTAIRGLGLVVQADFTLDPELSADPPRPAVSLGLAKRQARIAGAATARSPQRGTSVTSAVASVHRVGPTPAPASTVTGTTRGR